MGMRSMMRILRIHAMQLWVSVLLDAAARSPPASDPGEGWLRRPT